MITNIFFIFSLILLFSILTFAIIFIVSFVFIGDLHITLSVLKGSFKLSCSKKAQEKNIEYTTNVLNELFQLTAEEVAGMSDRKLMELIDASKQEAKDFKTAINSILKDPNITFFTQNDVRFLLQKTHSHSFMNVLISNVRINSDMRFQLLQKSLSKYDQNQLSSAKLYSIIKDIFNMSDKQVQIELRMIKRKNKTFDDIIQFNFIKNFFSLNNQIANINFLYKFVPKSSAL